MNVGIGDRLRPCASEHAIKSVSFAIELDSPFEKDAFREISLLHAKLQDRLPRKTENTSITINLDPSKGLQARNPKPELNGVIFDRLMPDGKAEWSLDASPPHVSVRCSNYSRWDSVLSEARKLFCVVLPVVFRFRAVTAIGLQYVDEFDWTGDKSEFRSDYLFRPDSNYLARNVFELTDPWHNHHGFFRRFDKPRPHRNLTNVNIGVLDREESRVITISTVHRALLSERIVEIDDLMGSEDRASAFDEFLEAMHQLNKDVLKDLLVEEMSRRIKLS